MDYDKVAEAITEKTKASVAVDLGGIVADYDNPVTAKLYVIDSDTYSTMLLAEEY